ncbi:MAG: SBBP repeat-containing protein, partial [Actinomycetota bacterium]
ADPSAIRLELEGVADARIDPAGDLVLADAAGAEVRHRRPVVYQEVEGARRSVEADFRLERGANAGEPYRVAFHVAEYDRSRALVIDPVVVYSTYFGGSGAELARGAGIALDAYGNAYLAGDTESVNLPGAEVGFSGGRRDAFVTKLNAPGTAVLFTTYLGGSDGDVARGIAVDGAGHAYVVGETFSANFPTANAYQATLRGFPGSDAFLAKLDPTGASLVYSTYLGGTTGSDSGAAVALDNAGNAWVAGSTSAPDFPRVAALQPGLGGGADAFVASFSPTGGALLFSTHLGGGGTDRAAGIAAGPGGVVAVAGGTESANFPTAGAVQAAKGFGRDGFVTLLAPRAESILYSTFLGGNGVDAATGVAMDPSGSAAVTGFTGSGDFPTVNPRQAHYGGRSDAFVTRFAPGGESLIYSTYLGGSGTENNGAVETGGIAVDAEGSAFVTGFTSSRNFLTVGASQKRSGGRSDAFVARLSPDGGELLYSTYLGGKRDDLGLGIAIDLSGNAYVAGQTASTNFPLRYAAQRARSGASDAFIAKLGSVDASTTPLLVLGSPVVEFGTIRTGAFGLRPVKITNGGRARLICSLGAPEAPFSFLSGGGEFSLTPRKSKQIFLQFKPTEPGEYTAFLELLTNDPYRPSTLLRLHGVLPAPEE